MDSQSQFDNKFDLNNQLLQLLNSPEINFLSAEVLIAAGANVNIENEHGETVLMLAAKLGNTDSVVNLLSAPGILINKENSTYDTALILAARYDQACALSALLADPRIEINHSALREAAGNGCINAVRVLLSYPHIDVNAADSWGDTALMEAALAGRIHTLNALLAAPGINIHLANKEGETAIMQADENSFEACVKFLAHKGAVLPEKIQKKKTPAEGKEDEIKASAALLIQLPTVAFQYDNLKNTVQPLSKPTFAEVAAKIGKLALYPAHKLGS